MELQFDSKGNDKQKQAAAAWIDETTSQILFGGAKYGGKSFLGGNLIFGDALIYPKTHYFIARDSLTDLRKYTIPTIYEVFDNWGLEHTKYLKFNGQDSVFDLYNESKVYLIEASHRPSDPDFHRFGSIQMTRGWCEEIGQMNPKAIANLYLTVGRWNNREYNLKKKLLLTCNPHKGYGYTEFYMPNKKGMLPEDKKMIISLPEDNKSGDPEYIESLRNNPNKNERERLFYGNWEYDDDPATLISFDKIQDCFTNDFDSLKGEKFITADIARLGSDKIVILLWDGWRCKIKWYNKEKLNITGNVIEQWRNQFGIPKSSVLCDEDGVGGGVVDFMGYKGFVNNSRALPNPLTRVDDNYNNLKSQCYFRLADRINKGGLFIECDDTDIKNQIIQELEQVKQYNMDKDGKKQILPKDKVKELIGRSPDFADALMMREYFELKPRMTWVAR